MEKLKTEHPGYLGSQDSYYVVFKGIGQTQQPLLIPTLEFFKLYTERTAITADLLNDRRKFTPLWRTSARCRPLGASYNDLDAFDINIAY
ncbi:hypothetical protein NPIL_596311 [Nephila pilipes]|uniref:Uncharacterized protein n=1 Tax=Nephila pilipes TaxID=299642 RepID=A0A8X6N3E8_NEPPI|nr:hypothetical protein NPIL_596311 [Nephila pilipes]